MWHEKTNQFPREHISLATRLILSTTLLLVVNLATSAESAFTNTDKYIEKEGSNGPANLAYITNSPPKDYSEETLYRAIHEKISSADLGTIKNPLLSTPEMKAWALMLTKEATNDIQKAKILCDALSQRGKYLLPYCSSNFTAEDVFAVWRKTDHSLRCGEIASLYVSLARSLGLKAYLVDVQQEWNGDWYPHACAAVFFDGKGILVDPTFGIFGVRHKKFNVLNDLQTVALFLSGEGDLQSYQDSVKLAPELLYGHLALFELYTSEGKWNEGAQQAKIVEALAGEGPVPLYAMGVMALGNGDVEKASNLLRKAIELAPLDETYYFQLGEILTMKGDSLLASNCYRNALACNVSESRVAAINRAISRLQNPDADYYWGRGWYLQVNDNLAGALTNYDKAILLKTNYTQAYFGRAYIKQRQGDLRGAEEDFGKAIFYDHRYAEAYDCRGTVRIADGNLSGAVADFNRAIELEPHSERTYINRGAVRQMNGDLDGALADFNKAIEITPDNSVVYYNRAVVKQTKGDLDGAIVDYNKTIELDPQFAKAYLNRGVVERTKGDIKEGAADFEKATQLDGSLKSLIP